MKKLPKPIVVFCPNDLSAWQLLHICRDCEINVPHEVAILGLDNDVLVCGFSKPTISCIDPNTIEIGRMAMRTLVEIINNPALARKPSATGRRMVLRNSWRSMHLGKLDCRRGKPFSRRVQHDLPSPGTAEGQSRTAVAKRMRTGVFE